MRISIHTLGTRGDVQPYFLAVSDKPIYVSFGSMPGLDPQNLAREVINGLAQACKRVVLSTNAGALETKRVPVHVQVISAAPHDQLFKHVCAALRHGGAATTGASLRAGLPTIICPFFGDQPFWARQVAHLGAGPLGLDRKALTADVLTAAFLRTDDPAIRGKANKRGHLIRQEEAIAQAVQFIEKVGSRRAH